MLPTATPTLFATERRHAALRIAPLVAPHAAHRWGKRSRYFRLLRKARLHQEHHRIGLGDRIGGAIVMHRQSGNDDYALICFDPQAVQRALMITVFDVAGDGSARLVGRSCAERTSAHSPEFGQVCVRKLAPQNLAASSDYVLQQEINKTGRCNCALAPRAAERPVISVAEIGYVRRSEISFRKV